MSSVAKWAQGDFSDERPISQIVDENALAGLGPNIPVTPTLNQTGEAQIQTSQIARRSAGAGLGAGALLAVAAVVAVLAWVLGGGD